jgi:DNA-binding GntR family transcriptional regulator
MVVETIRQRIRDGTYPPGSQIPSRPALRAEFGCSDMVINDAMRILRRDKFVAPLHGIGQFVCQELPE